MIQQGDKGVCPLSMIPCRAEPSDKAEIVNQLLFGERFEVVEMVRNWVRVRNQYDGYEGWMDPKQGKTDTAESGESCIATSLVAVATHKTSGRKVHVVRGSTLTGFDNGNFHLAGEQWQYSGEARKPAFSSLTEDAISYLGTPYLWGGRSPFGIDCSGFTQVVAAMNGILLPRDSGDQAKAGKHVGDLESAESGDLLFFSKDTKGSITHVAFLLEHFKVIHASGEVRIDELTHKGIVNTESGEISHFLQGIRRIRL